MEVGLHSGFDIALESHSVFARYPGKACFSPPATNFLAPSRSRLFEFRARGAGFVLGSLTNIKPDIPLVISI
jgi:hypothetical protein